MVRLKATTCSSQHKLCKNGDLYCHFCISKCCDNSTIVLPVQMAWHFCSFTEIFHPASIRAPDYVSNNSGLYPILCWRNYCIKARYYWKHQALSTICARKDSETMLAETDVLGVCHSRYRKIRCNQRRYHDS